MNVLTFKPEGNDLSYSLWIVEEGGGEKRVEGNFKGIGRGKGYHRFSYDYGNGEGVSVNENWGKVMEKLKGVLKLASYCAERFYDEKLSVEVTSTLIDIPSEKFGQHRNEGIIIDSSFINKLEEKADESTRRLSVFLQSVYEKFPDATHVGIFDDHIFKSAPEEISFYPVSVCSSGKNVRVAKLSHGGLRLKSILTNARTLLRKLPRRIVICDIDETVQITSLKGETVVATTYQIGGRSIIFSQSDCGAVNPFVIKHLAQQTGYGYREIVENMISRGGIRGIDEGFDSMYELVESISRGNITFLSKMLLNDIVYSIAGQVALLGGIELLIISGKIGRQFPSLRRFIASRLHILRLNIDDEKNEEKDADIFDITGRDCRIKVVVASADEDRILSMQAVRIVGRDAP